MKIEYVNIHVKLGGKDILKGVSLQSQEGKIVGIIGPNGCGKSTLIKTTFGIVPHQNGEILIDGKNTRALTTKELASYIGYVGQDTMCAFDFSVRDVVEMGLFARKKKKRQSRDLVNEALDKLQISQFADRSILQLSGGERKMVFIARAMVQGADLMIMDEPTNHLDIKHQLFLMDYIRKSGKTVIVVNHDLRLASHYCDYIYMLHDGSVYAEGTPLEVLSRKNVDQVFGITGYAYHTEYGARDFALFDKKRR